MVKCGRKEVNVLINGIIENIIAGCAATFLAAIFKKLWRFLIKDISGSVPIPTKTNSAKSIKKQFFIALFAIPVFLICFIQLNNITNAFLAFLKVFLLLGTGFSIVFAWGAFEAAFSFYPPDNYVYVPSNSDSDDDTCKHPKVH